MDELYPVYATAGIIVLYFLFQVLSGKFDPFAPTWLFFVGYVHVYIIQALTYRDWGVAVRGKDLVLAANLRASWALLWFLTVYHLPVGKLIAAALPAPPRRWRPQLIATISPPLILWGLFCAGLMVRSGAAAQETASAEMSLLSAFPFVMMVAAVLLIVTGRTLGSYRPAFVTAGLLTSFAYVMIWMFNGKRSHSLIGVLSTVCAFYIARLRRPSWPVLLATGFMGSLVVAIAIGWRGNPNYERSFAGFFHFIGDFQVSKILQSLNVTNDEDNSELVTYETVEYGGFLLMMDTVPEKSGYDYGENYKRLFSTFIPRIIWPSKPYYGRAQWVSAWMAGSEMERDEDFTGPAIGILGATQLNGGAIGTLIVMACVAALLSTAYSYLRLHADSPWAQFWWAISYYNAWFMVVNDDPLVWFYYNWGFSTCPIVVLIWWANRSGPLSEPGTVAILHGGGA
jgi:hypothetical protein